MKRVLQDLLPSSSHYFDLVATQFVVCLQSGSSVLAIPISIKLI